MRAGRSMDIAIINSRQDPAGITIRRHLLALLHTSGETVAEHGGRRYTFLETEGRLIHETGLDRRVDADLVIFISRHTSMHPFPALTVHATGNYRDAALGGEPGTLPPAAPEWMHAILGKLARFAPAGFRVSYEVTHHGPTDLQVPSLFVEIGSTAEEWADDAAGLAVARSILDAQPAAGLNLIGFGGNHYAARQTAISLGTPAAFGHIAHTREVEHLDAGMVERMRAMTGAEAAYIDRKALAAPVLRRIERLLADAGIPRLSESELYAVAEIGWENYRAFLELAGVVAPGARLHLNRITGAGTPVAVRLDPGRVDEALRIDRDAFFRGAGALPVIHLTSERGDLLPVFLTYEAHRSGEIHDLITLCVKIIISDEQTAADGDCLIIRKIRFDPDKARSLGVPKGPLFGRLAAGFEIEVQGAIITPAMVSTCSEKKIHVPGLERYT
jgi:D-aminoacyl-tRNA deacylase